MKREQSAGQYSEEKEGRTARDVVVPWPAALVRGPPAVHSVHAGQVCEERR